jgi:hypothetical protein
VARDAEDSREPEIEKLRAWIGQPTVEWDFRQEVPRMSAPDRGALVDREEMPRRTARPKVASYAR